MKLTKTTGKEILLGSWFLGGGGGGLPEGGEAVLEQVRRACPPRHNNGGFEGMSASGICRHNFFQVPLHKRKGTALSKSFKAVPLDFVNL